MAVFSVTASLSRELLPLCVETFSFAFPHPVISIVISALVITRAKILFFISNTPRVVIWCNSIVTALTSNNKYLYPIRLSALQAYMKVLYYFYTKGDLFMEFRVLQYFLAVTREQSISGAAEALHLSQPTLSRQLKDMEEELGKQLFIRSNRKITLTEEGMILRKRAEEITELVKKAQDEISLSDENVAGDISIGAGETDGVRYLAKGARDLQKDYPLVHFHIVSGDKTTVLEDLDKGLIDFALLFGEIDSSRYDCLKLPCADAFGVLMRRDDPLAEKDIIMPEDLWDKPLIVSRQSLRDSNLSTLLGYEAEKLNIVATYNLLFNGSLMVDEGMGYAICFDKIINTSGGSNLCFKPLSQCIEIKMSLAWKKYQVFTKAAEKFLLKMQELN